MNSQKVTSVPENDCIEAVRPCASVAAELRKLDEGRQTRGLPMPLTYDVQERGNKKRVWAPHHCVPKDLTLNKGIGKLVNDHSISTDYFKIVKIFPITDNIKITLFCREP